MSSVLNTVCRKTDTVVTQSSDSPYRTKTAGPRRNSPLPIDAPSTITPGPTTVSQPSPLGDGGTGSSARVHGSSPDRASGASATSAATDVGTAVMHSPLRISGGLGGSVSARRKKPLAVRWRNQPTADEADGRQPEPGMPSQ